MDEPARVFEAQLGADFLLNPPVRGGGQRDAGNAGEMRRQAIELAIFLAKIMAPLRNAVCLVDGEKADTVLRNDTQGLRHQESFRRDR